MLLSQTTVYGLRAIATLASLAPAESINAADLSVRTGVPRQYLSKVMRKLVLGKLVHGRRGHGGGFSLLRPPRDIRLGDVLSALDEPINDECVFGYDSCGVEHPCALHPIWAKLKECITKWTTECTMAELGPTPPTNPAPARGKPGRRRSGASITRPGG